MNRLTVFILLFLVCSAGYSQSFLPGGAPSGADFFFPANEPYLNHGYDAMTNRTSATNSADTNRRGMWIMPSQLPLLALDNTNLQRGTNLNLSELTRPPRHRRSPNLRSSLSVDAAQWAVLAMNLKYETTYKDKFAFGVSLSVYGEEANIYGYTTIFTAADLGLSVKWQFFQGAFFAPDLEVTEFWHLLLYRGSAFPLCVDAGCKLFLPSLPGPFVEPKFGVLIKEGSVYPVFQVMVGFDFGRRR